MPVKRHYMLSRTQQYKGINMDPLFVYMAAASLAVLLLVGGLDKLRHLDLFEGAVLAYRLLPAALSKPFSVLFVVSELSAAVLLLIPQARLYGALLAVLVLGAATAGVAINLFRGHTDVACGCGNLKEQSAGLSWWLVIRNAVLLGVITLFFLPQHLFTERHLNWVDGLTFFGSTLAMLGLYFAVNQLIESHVKLQKLKEI